MQDDIIGRRNIDVTLDSPIGVAVKYDTHGDSFLYSECRTARICLEVRPKVVDDKLSFLAELVTAFPFAGDSAEWTAMVPGQQMPLGLDQSAFGAALMAAHMQAGASGVVT